MIRKLFFVAFTLLPFTSWAYDIEVDGIYYDLDNENMTAEVVCSTYQGRDYAGDVVIPSSVINNNLTFTVTSIGVGAFNCCYDLNSVTIPNTVTIIKRSAFSACEHLVSVEIPNSVETIDMEVFVGCSELQSISLPNSVTTIGENAFKYCEKLVSITIPSGVASIKDKTFEGCSGLTLVNIPESVTTIGEGAFTGCQSLIGIEIPTSVVSIGASAFMGTGLTSVEIPNSISEIANSVFSRCNALVSVKIPSSVTIIGANAFSRCTHLADVYCYAEDIPVTATDAFKDALVNRTCVLHVPSSSLDSYKAANPWRTFHDIVPLEDTEDGIKSVTDDSGENVIYDLSGRRHDSLQKGLNIVFGKKVLRK